MSEEPLVLVCRCAYEGALPPARLRAVLDLLEKTGAPHRTVPDLCALAARRDPWLLEWTRRPGRRIVACHPRAIVNLLAWAGVEDPAAVQAEGLRPPSAAPGEAGGRTEVEATDWVPWFPVIDGARCTQCRQCLDFCLFGVYVQDEGGRVEVRHPERCKLHCPACARVCPHTAIIFPKHDEAPIDGAEIADEAAEKARVDREIQALLGGDLHAALAERKRRAAARRGAAAGVAAAAEAPAGRPRLLDDERVRRALAERARCARGGGPAP